MDDTYIRLDGYDPDIKVGDTVMLKCVVKGVAHEHEIDWSGQGLVEGPLKTRLTVDVVGIEDGAGDAGNE
jgi:hypothetical protein